MPIKLNWTRGRNLGLALIFLGVMGFVQIIFMIIAQYAMKIGSRYAVIFVPIGVTLALFYAIIILLESRTSIVKYREARAGTQKKKKEITLSERINWALVRPAIVIVIIFSALFGFTLLVTQKLEPVNAYIIAQNVGAIGSLIFATYMEADAKRKTR